MMNVRALILLLCVGATPSIALAEDHLAEALKLTQQALAQGKLGSTDRLVAGAEAALEQADEAEKGRRSPHLLEAIAHLEAAIDHGKQSHGDLATKHLEDAVRQLEAVPKE